MPGSAMAKNLRPDLRSLARSRLREPRWSEAKSEDIEKLREAGYLVLGDARTGYVILPPEVD